MPFKEEDDVNLYHVHFYTPPGVGKAQLGLARKKNGDCYYLDRETGCVIYEQRPVVCRKYDCKGLLVHPPKRLEVLIRSGELSAYMVEAAKRRVEQNV